MSIKTDGLRTWGKGGGNDRRPLARKVIWRWGGKNRDSFWGTLDVQVDIHLLKINRKNMDFIHITGKLCINKYKMLLL